MTNPDCGFEPRFEIIWTATYVDEEEVLKPSTIASPWAVWRASFTVRSLEIPPLNTYRLGSVAAPDWSTEAFFPGRTSYQRTSAPAPPSTQCETQTVVLPTAGSMPETAWVMRPSSVSSNRSVSFCGASGGDW